MTAQTPIPDVVELPPDVPPYPDGARAGGWWHRLPEQDRIVCDLCPRECHLKPGDRGFCFVRENRDGIMVLATYGRSTGFCVDPIEKKPLNHFYPGTSVLSFGTAGCNLGCKFCQNWDISKSREIARLSERAGPEQIADAAARLGCHSVAFTYNDPVIWAEYAIDVARACHQRGLKTVAVTAGYITPLARGPFYQVMDAANVDLKAFTEEFYQRLTLSHLQPVLDTLKWLRRETNVWLEITNLIIPQANDSPDEIRRMCDWILDSVGDCVPLHFTAFHPDFRLRDRPRTPPETLIMAWEIARRQGLKYVYTGNVHDKKHQSTWCHACGGLLVERDWYQLGQYHVRDGRCAHCGAPIPGHFTDQPGQWGRRRLPITFRDQPPPPPTAAHNIGGQTMKQPTSTPSRDAASQCCSRPDLSDQQQRAIHEAACRLVAAAAAGRPTAADPALRDVAELPVNGVFVTIMRRGRLRGCCGMLGGPMRLWDALHQAARRTALDDPRLPPLSPSELPFVDLSVSILYGLAPMQAEGDERLRAVVVGRHGLQIRRGNRSGLLLPTVPVDHGWDERTFLEQVCIKAGLPRDAWREDSQLLTFEAVVIKQPIPQSVLSHSVPRVPPLSADQLPILARHAQQNVVAHTLGATPNYYVNVSDGMVNGVFVQWQPAESGPIALGKLSLRPPMPLQATLFQLTQHMADQLQRLGASGPQLQSATLSLTILHDPAMHGTVEDPDLRGIDPSSRAVLVADGPRFGWVFDPQMTPEQLVAAARREAEDAGRHAQLFSFAALTTSRSGSFSTVAQPQPGPAVRPPTVAGAFYPAEPAEMNRMLDELIGQIAEPAQPWPAALVPHAGWKYSGRIAAEVLKRVRIPDTVIVIGPKHTPLGVRWAVAPHETWSLPGIEVRSDPELAKTLARQVPGLKLDAAAHWKEHGIEVELPLIARLAPQARVVGIAIGGGDLDECRRFAGQLAQLIRSLPQRPLLIISSDMNHYATDAENRRRDKLAIAQMKQLDPEGLYRTCREHQISMCGMLPAVIVMETLRHLGGLKKSKLVAYGTSADVTGDTSRVVGYAGMLFA